MREILQNVLREVYGTQLVIEAVIDENMVVDERNNKTAVADPEPEVGMPVEDAPTASPNVPDMMSDLLKTFGGKIVG